MPARIGSVLVAALAALLLPGCAALQQKDPLNVAVAGIEPLQGQGLELRLEVKLRVQNPNDAPVEYDGVAVQMDVQGKTFATGVADVTGSVPRFGEAVISVPVTISAFRMARQVMGAMKGGGIGKIEYAMKGKLNTGFSPTRFATQGSFDLAADAIPDTH
ncbi:MAG TPA: LEA type 2 family protein [Steroidobacteraceae bacterium]